MLKVLSLSERIPALVIEPPENMARTQNCETIETTPPLNHTGVLTQENTVSLHLEMSFKSVNDDSDQPSAINHLVNQCVCVHHDCDFLLLSLVTLQSVT